jgi:heme O synthase-like polyprenyltransferase
MDQQNFHPVLLILFFAAIFLILGMLNSPALIWTVFGVLGIAIMAVIANLLYAFIALELGYDPEREKAKRLHQQSSHTLQHLLGMLHVRTLRHH